MSKVTITLEDREGGMFVDVTSDGIKERSHALHWSQFLLKAIDEASNGKLPVELGPVTLEQ